MYKHATNLKPFNSKHFPSTVNSPVTNKFGRYILSSPNFNRSKEPYKKYIWHPLSFHSIHAPVVLVRQEQVWIPDRRDVQI